MNVNLCTKTHRTFRDKVYPRSEWDQFEDTFDGKTKGEGEIHVAQYIS